MAIIDDMLALTERGRSALGESTKSTIERYIMAETADRILAFHIFDAPERIERVRAILESTGAYEAVFITARVGEALTSPAA